jgi:glycosyltransferase involved in cell wall biosynthesis
MKICYVTNGDISSRAAYAVNIASMCNAFHANGHEVSLLVPNHTIKAYDVNLFYTNFGVNQAVKVIPIYSSSLPIFKSYIFLFYAAIKVRALKPELTFVRFIQDYLYLLFAGKEPVIIERHVPLERNSLMRWIQVYMYRRANLKGLVLITLALKDLIVEEENSFADKIMVLSDGANILPSNQQSKALMGNFTKNIGYIGHLYDGRGIDLIIKLASENTSTGFHLIGGAENDIQRWKEFAGSLNNVFFYGFKPHHEVSAYAINFDLLLAPYQASVSVNGGSNTVNWMSPLKIFEYMSYHKPFICSDLPVLREVLVPGHNCLLAVHNNKQDWQRAIDQVYQDPTLAAALISGAKADLEYKFSWKSRASKIVDFLKV